MFFSHFSHKTCNFELEGIKNVLIQSNEPLGKINYSYFY